MKANYLDMYLQITKGFDRMHSEDYTSPENQADNIKICSILKDVPIEYSNFTTSSAPSSET